MKIEKTILLIDDEEILRDSVSMMLTSESCKILFADGGKSGIKMLNEYIDEIDIILLDLMMPDMYGIDVLKHIRADKKFEDIKIILQTGSNDQKEISSANILGVSAYIAKPYNKSMLMDIIKDL